jgi:transcriptional regulator with XRE-family HTH domain
MPRRPPELTGEAKRQATVARKRRSITPKRAAADVGDRIRELREEREMSQGKLAMLADTTQSSIARMEAGRVQPRLDTLSRIAIELDCELHVSIDPLPLDRYMKRERLRREAKAASDANH